MASAEEEVAAGDEVVLFDNDTGILERAERETLVLLLRKRFITAASDPDAWSTLMASRSLITSRMHDLLLDIHVDLLNEVAYKKRVAFDDAAQPVSLLRNSKWSAPATALLVILRERLRADRMVSTDDVFVDFDDLVAAMEQLLPTSTDQSRPTTVTRGAIKQVESAHLLKEVGGNQRYKINTALESVLPLAKLLQLKAMLTADNSAENNGAEDNGAEANPAASGDDSVGDEGAR